MYTAHRTVLLQSQLNDKMFFLFKLRILVDSCLENQRNWCFVLTSIISLFTLSWKSSLIFTYFVLIFRFLIRALQIFCDTSAQGLPPLGGSIPDMVSTTGFFVSLQRIYQVKAAADRVTFSALLLNVILESTRVSAPHSDMKMTRKSATEISVETIDTFCKNVFNLRSVSTRTYSDERLVPATEAFGNAVQDPFEDPKQVHFYFSIEISFPCEYSSFHSSDGR